MIIQKESKQLFIQKLATLYQRFVDEQDEVNASKIIDLYKKQKNDQFIMSFAGHFSAGKSSMINAILGNEILPKSPVPTSANIVTISGGAGFVRVYFHNGEIIEIEEPYDLELIKQYSKDRDQIKQLDIRSRDSVLPKDTVIMDTPGIDAADDADRLMTESAMHLVDVLFYIMDYNHVQSEVNLQFLESLQAKQIPYYVIINQVDKHDDTELPFATFDASIKQTFEQWGIMPQRILYSSLTNLNVKYNEFRTIQDIIHTMIEKDIKQHDTTPNALNTIVKAHEKYLDSIYEEKMPTLGQDLSENDIHAELADLVGQRDDKLERPNVVHQELMSEVQQTLKNAYVMPASLREKAKLFLASRQPDFKVGFFGAKKKTKEEQEVRLQAFLEELHESVKSSIEWRIKEKLTATLTEYQIHETTLLQEVQDLEVFYTENDLLRFMKTGATINGDYVLNYTNDVASDIKALFKKQAINLADKTKTYVAEQNASQLDECNKQIAQLEQIATIRNKRNEFEKELTIKKNFLREQLETDHPYVESVASLEKTLQVRKDQIKLVSAPTAELSTQIEQKGIATSHYSDDENDAGSQNEIVLDLNKTIHILEDIPGVQHLVDDLLRKKHRLEERSYTVALFGAFSAGKSSFANALLGDNVLPVSPNPTTATVNRINPVTENTGHGTVQIRVKQREELERDLLEILKAFKPPTTALKGLLHWVEENSYQYSDDLNPLYQSYLQAMMDGYQDMEKHIGEKLFIQAEELGPFVTDEKKACYIDVIDLYYDCELTRQGITLVDTPGADSVNARHTNTAFTYIKHADAILYVTYYNHALSRADKDFLMQLGRVKDTFELDKMFFLVNAADLASNAEELNLVTDYVQEQLIQLGIRFPRIFPLSSKQSLKEKKQKSHLNEKMAAFETAFQSFIKKGLSSLTVSAAKKDMNRAKSTLAHLLESSKMDQQQKKELELKLSKKQVEMERTIKEYETNVLTRQIYEKIGKQLFHVLERFGIRFHDMFKETFNPTTITQSGKAAQPELKTALQQLLDYASFELYQEAQAVSLRMEAFINNLLQQMYMDLSAKLYSLDDRFSVPDFEKVLLTTPLFEKGMETSVADYQNVLATYKGTKAFFANNEKEQMKEALYKQIRPVASEYVDTIDAIMKEQYEQQWENHVKEIRSNLHVKVEQYVESNLAVLTTPLDTEKLTEKLETMDEILAK
ncbi:dynamin family protein [Oceanobacillus kapialis]|uniref:Dynamin family protein n=1 Tax=Oceanobacillus kapialis TaxID=481353 RepID=A0ABW5Q4R9_9BACI